MMSGGPIRKFTEGWAVAIFRGWRAHYFVRFQVSGMAAAVCGGVVAPVRSLREGGCKNCERYLERAGAHK